MTNYTHIIHESIPLFIDDDSTILILGSLPSVKSREVGFYYGHPRNRFFAVLSKMCGENEPLSVSDRKEFLRKHHIALYDVIYECDICGSSDSSIRNVVPIDIKSILDKYPKIKKIGINGKKAQSLFDRYLLDIAASYDVEILYLPSTSPANARMNVSTLVEKYLNVNGQKSVTKNRLSQM